jgi:hypothetical protein
MTDVPDLTPVGDWIRKRYPPKESTHWLGNPEVPDDPGCAAVHIPCTYDSGWREGLWSFAAHLDGIGQHDAAELARESAEHPGTKL